MASTPFSFARCHDALDVEVGGDGALALADLVGLVRLVAVDAEAVLLGEDATVRSPSSVPARKMRTAISLRLASACRGQDGRRGLT
jgi:hypothetical protein